MMTWCVAHTLPRKEETAQKHLLDQGFDVYLPKFQKLSRHSRKVEEVLKPLFPRYLFIGVDLDLSSWHRINGTRGISYLIMANEMQPALVPTFIIEGLKAQEITKNVIPFKSLVSFIKGDKVLINEGSLKDQTVVFEKLDDKGRARLLLNLLGKDIQFSLLAYAIQAA